MPNFSTIHQGKDEPYKEKVKEKQCYFHNERTQPRK